VPSSEICVDTVEDGVGRGDKYNIIFWLTKVLHVALALDKTAPFSDCLKANECKG